MRPKPILFGEVLFDSFPDGQKVLGGAPFNVCWHLRGFGEDPLFASRVGDDEGGREVRRRMRRQGLDLSALQTDPQLPTGEVRITLSPGGQPSFDIRADQAYDRVELEDLLSRIDPSRPAILYRGTLAARGAHNTAVLDQLHRRLQLPEFIDINLRPPWWQREAVLAALRRARWAKLNDDELQTLTGCGDSESQLREAATAALADWSLDLMVLTRGARGALWVEPRAIAAAPAPRVEQVADTVGAGDAFAAVSLLGLIRGWPGETTLRRALDFAAEVCRRRGATIEQADVYQHYLHEWTDDG